jgi:hypothetical protein
MGIKVKKCCFLNLKNKKTILNTTRYVINRTLFSNPFEIVSIKQLLLKTKQWVMNFLATFFDLYT